MSPELALEILALQDLLARYGTLLDAREMEPWAQLWMPDAQVHLGETVWRGRDEIVDRCAASRLGVHLGGLPQLSIDGDRAVGRQNFVFVAADRSMTIGRYDDVYLKTDGVWRFVVRSISMVAAPVGMIWPEGITDEPHDSATTSGDSNVDSVSSRGPDAELLVENHGAVRLVCLNRPSAFNAANEQLHGEVARIWRELDADPEVRAIVLTGSGGAFCAGGDLGLLDRMVHDRALRAEIMAEGAEIVRAMTSVRVPIVAAVNGPAVGLGCSLAGMSDLVVMEEQAYLADPHVSLGLVAADGGALTWPLLTSLLRAKEYLLLGERLPALEAERLGLANRVVAAGTSREVALDLAQRMARLPPQAVRETKALLQHLVARAVDSTLDTAIATETASFDEAPFQSNLARALLRTRG